MAKHIAVIDKTGRGHSICQALITTNNDVTVHYIPGTAGIFDKRILTVPSISLKVATDPRPSVLKHFLTLLLNRLNWPAR